MLTRFDPWRELENMRKEIERLFDESLFRRALPSDREVATMPLDIYEEGNNLVVKASIPGIRPEDIKVELRGDVLRIYGESKAQEEKKERNYHLREHRYNRFERSGVLADKAEAVFENGVRTYAVG
ncbi:Hsp20/alpha crystallin family protein [Meiothermus rufus]|uniref:Hsp20/alpha crystallin family protein n=1 Tax=Meiothermus rufus TaxID=604332 RepID=UPI00040A615B|nr:Hsp20/alpha crystallin family protein [Meiothermus rufus]